MIFGVDMSVTQQYQRVYERFLEMTHSLGLKYKKASRLILDDSIEAAAIWNGRSEDDGDIRIRRCTEPQTIAHELGHGVYEKYGYFGNAKHGETFANAVRWLVESRLDQPSPWFGQFKTNCNPDCKQAHFILARCDFDPRRFADLCNNEAEMKHALQELEQI